MEFVQDSAQNSTEQAVVTYNNPGRFLTVRRRNRIVSGMSAIFSKDFAYRQRRWRYSGYILRGTYVRLYCMYDRVHNYLSKFWCDACVLYVSIPFRSTGLIQNRKYVCFFH